MEKLAQLTIGQIVGSGAGILLLLSIFIEIVPVKFCPISMFLNWIGRKINGDLSKKVEELDNKLNKKVADVDDKLNEIQAKSDERDAVNCRIRILKFGDEISHGEMHSKESFEQVIGDIDDYERYCNAHPEFLNNRTHVTTHKILSAYGKCMDENSFS